jgi:hypothetical protein
MKFEEFQHHILNGTINIHQPIQMKSKEDIDHSVSFLTYLLKYPMVHKENIHIIFFNLFQEFYKTIHQYIHTEPVQILYTKLLSDWGVSDVTIDIQNIFNDEIHIYETIEKAVNACNEAEFVITQPQNETLEMKLTGGSQLEREVSSSAIICSDTLQGLKTHQESIQKIIDNLSKLSMNIFLELSMKQKSFYLDIHPDSQDIPETIHQIFLNFVFVYNLFLKQLHHQKEHISQILSGLEMKTKEIIDLHKHIKKLSKSKKSNSFF